MIYQLNVLMYSLMISTAHV